MAPPTASSNMIILLNQTPLKKKKNQQINKEKDNISRIIYVQYLMWHLVFQHVGSEEKVILPVI